MDIGKFGQILNQEPTNILKRSGFDYLPVSHIETLLDEIFGAGCWSCEMQSIQVIGNEILGICNLKVFHPILLQWITRTGTAATQIRQSKGAENTDVNAKLKNALEMDVPHLKSDCLKNAAKTLGRVFGRDLNRAFEDIYDPKESVPDALMLIANATSMAELSAAKAMVNMNNPAIKVLAISKYSELSKNEETK